MVAFTNICIKGVEKFYSLVILLFYFTLTCFIRFTLKEFAKVIENHCSLFSSQIITLIIVPLIQKININLESSNFMHRFLLILHQVLLDYDSENSIGTLDHLSRIIDFLAQCAMFISNTNNEIDSSSIPESPLNELEPNFFRPLDSNNTKEISMNSPLDDFQNNQEENSLSSLATSILIYITEYGIFNTSASPIACLSYHALIRIFSSNLPFSHYRFQLSALECLLRIKIHSSYGQTLFSSGSQLFKIFIDYSSSHTTNMDNLKRTHPQIFITRTSKHNILETNSSLSSSSIGSNEIIDNIKPFFSSSIFVQQHTDESISDKSPIDPFAIILFDRPCYILNMSPFLSAISDCLISPRQWSIHREIFMHLRNMLEDASLISTISTASISSIRLSLCSIVSNDILSNSTIYNIPNNIRKADIFSLLYTCILALINQRHRFTKTHQDEIVRCFEIGLKKYSDTIMICVHSLSICCLEMPLSLSKFLPSLLLHLTRIMSVTSM